MSRSATAGGSPINGEPSWFLLTTFPDPLGSYLNLPPPPVQLLGSTSPDRHELQVFPNYGHQDVFMGKNNHVDIFPPLLEFLSKHRV